MRKTAARFYFPALFLLTCALLPLRFHSQQTSTVQGTVLELVSEQPVRDALIVLSGTGGYFRVNSDSTGKFVIEGVAPGEYKATVTHDGYFWSKSRSGPATINVTAGFRNIAYRLLKGSAISGRILSQNGEPESGIGVILQRSEYRNGLRVLSRVNAERGSRTSTSTDRRGDYRLYGLQPGEYYLSVGSGDTLSFYAGTGDLNAAIPIVVAPGQDLGGINIQQVRSRMFTVTASVSAPPSSNSLEISIGTITPRDPFKLQLDLGGSAFQSMGLSSRYVSPPIKPGEYLLTLTAPAAGLSASVPFDVVDRDVDLGTLAFSPGITISGRVRISDPRIELKGTVLRLNPVNARIVPPSSVTAADGTFSISKVAEGQYWVGFPNITRDINREIYLESVRYGARPPERGDISVTKEPDGPLEIVLGVGGAVTGTVRNSRGEPTPYSPVLVYPSRGRQHPSYFKTAEADANGVFTITALAPGEYRVLAWEDSLPSLYMDPRFLGGLDQRSTTVTVRAGTPANADVRAIP